MTFWGFVSEHPFWTFIYLMVIAGTVETVVYRLRK